MTTPDKPNGARGFTLIEMLVSTAILVLVAGAIFGLLGAMQKRSWTESELLSSFQSARLGLDEITRDADDAGYPPQNQFSTAPLANVYAFSPVAWSPTYPATPCLIGTAGGGTCLTPGDFDVIFEEAVGNTGVRWIRYQLQGTTLMRGVTPKVAGADPSVATLAPGVMLPYVFNVMNNASVAQIARLTAAYPSIFPGGRAQPIFQFYCDTPGGVVLCQNAGLNNSPANVRDVEITLIVQSPVNDAQNGLPRLIELNGRGHRVNPNH